MQNWAMVSLWLARGIQSHRLSYYLAIMYIMRAIFLGLFSLTVAFVFQFLFIHIAAFLKFIYLFIFHSDGRSNLAISVSAGTLQLQSDIFFFNS